MLDVARFFARTAVSSARLARSVVWYAPAVSASLSVLALARVAVAVSPRPSGDGVHPDWEHAGEILADGKGALTFPPLPRDAGLWCLAVPGDEDGRVGDADDLASALPRAAKAAALRRWIADHLQAGRTVLVAVACTASLRAAGAETAVDLSLESVRAMATQAARERLPAVKTVPAASEAASESSVA